jgi:predicted house-cleaning noncanonical NTP pyrophosphatase (MazG superfamily)
MRKFLQNKLWRDKAVEIMEAHGSRIHWQTLDDEAFLKQLRLKLLEEAEEVASAKNRHEMVSELADLFEVIDTLIEANNLARNEIIETQLAKQKKRGGFLERKFVEIAEHPVGSSGEQYCLLDPKKYPEII